MTDLDTEYWRRVVPDPVDLCWRWSGILINGRAYLSDTHGPKRLVRVTRWLWEQKHGPLTPGQIIRHTCDHPECVKPAHLRVGTQADNMRDMIARGRSLVGDRNPMRTHPESRPRGSTHGTRTRPDRIVKGSQHGMARLTEADVLAIRADKRPARYAAEEYGVTIGHVREIRRREVWRHI